MTIGIVGRGRAGRAFLASLPAARARIVRIGRGAALPRLRTFDLLVLAVPDDAIRLAAARLAGLGFRARFALHFSGALGSEALGSLAAGGAKTLSFHPLRSFAGRPGEAFAGCPIALEGDPAGLRFGERLARRLGGVPWRIWPPEKPRYHAAATLAAGGTAALVAASSRAAVAAGLPARLALAAFADLARGAAKNVGELGFPAGLTGPFARGDRRTTGLHRRALRATPDLLVLYEAVLRLTRHLRKGRPAGRRKGPGSSH